jgi:hypothetical protein
LLTRSFVDNTALPCNKSRFKTLGGALIVTSARDWRDKFLTIIAEPFMAGQAGVSQKCAGPRALERGCQKVAAHLAQFVEEIRWWDARTIRLNFRSYSMA